MDIARLIVETVIVIAAIVLGVRTGGVGIGLAGGATTGSLMPW